jgi:tetratricopeptide (TPR) repeat protein
MRNLLSIFLFFLLIVSFGCSKKVVIVRTAETTDKVTPVAKPLDQNLTASMEHLQQAKMFYARDKYKQAMQHCEKAIEFDNRNWEAYYYLGMTMQKRREYAHAIDIFRSGLRYSPDNRMVKAELHVAIGQSLENLGRLEEAVHEYNTALTFNPENDSARAGKNRVEVEKTMKNWGKDKEIDFEG